MCYLDSDKFNQYVHLVNTSYPFMHALQNRQYVMSKYGRWEFHEAISGEETCQILRVKQMLMSRMFSVNWSHPCYRACCVYILIPNSFVGNFPQLQVVNDLIIIRLDQDMPVIFKLSLLSLCYSCSLKKDSSLITVLNRLLSYKP